MVVLPVTMDEEIIGDISSGPLVIVMWDGKSPAMVEATMSNKACTSAAIK